jgi:CheY-like chemotaxis protein
MSATLLIVEDDEDYGTLLLHTLAKFGVTSILWGRDGEHAVHLLTEQSNRGIRVIVSDIKMPKKNGFELLGWVRSNPHFQNIPFVFLTSSNQETDRDRASELGVTHYILKPATLREFEETCGLIIKLLESGS